MKIEQIDTTHLLRSHLAHEYANRHVFVADLNDVDSASELESLYKELEAYGYPIVGTFRLPGFLIIEMHQELAAKIINTFDHGFARLYLYYGSECIHENY